MARKLIRDVRHEELIQATIFAVHKSGFSGITLVEIAQLADISPASINYYFGSKEHLMMAVMRKLMTTLRDRMLFRLGPAKTPRERLLAMIEANFDDELFTLEQCSTWMQFWGAAPYSPKLERLHRINRTRVRSNFRSVLKSLVNEDLQETTRRSIQAYMDGVWIEAAQARRDLNGELARKEARKFVEMILDSSENLR